MNTVVYSKPACVQCDATYRGLDKRGIEYTSIDISQDHEALDKLISLKVLQAPYIEVTYDDGTVDSWSGFNLDKINGLVAA